MKKIMTAVFMFSALLMLAGCGKGGHDLDTPKGMTEAYLSYMKEGSYEKAAETVGTEFDTEAYENSAELQKNAMKTVYAKMEYKIEGENTEETKSTVSVRIKNVNYLTIMDDAIFETMQKQEDDAYTEKIFKEKLKEAEPQEAEVLVNYRKEEGKWVFDGSNSQLQAAMLGYLTAEK